MIRTSTAILAMIASTATAQEATHAVGLDSLTYAASPLSPLIETASVYETARRRGSTRRMLASGTARWCCRIPIPTP